MTRRTLSLATLLLALCSTAPAQAPAQATPQAPDAPPIESTWLRADARTQPPAPRSGHLAMGSAQRPDGLRLEANNRYLTLGGQPWLPVMGEFHYSRVPAAQWETQLLKLKAAGVDVVASYIIWSHHEAQPGHLDWHGERDLRRFVQLCQRHGLRFVARIGPWSHAEVRYGGLPPWLVRAAVPTRGNDAQYLAHVARFYGAIAQQLRGLLWKHGGPVIGVQLENEYNLGGPGQGREHIARLKQMAQAAGLDVPLYTVTGWDHTVYPRGEVLPVFGGYPDEPWKATDKALPPHEVYAFRFGSRVSGDLGAQTRSSRRGDAETDLDDTPFLGAEYGAGVPAMYRRRPLLAPEDVSAMAPVQLGSGVNLLGWYMFHGGRNPVGATTLEETVASGGYNDTPAINYDFQAPLGPDGDMRPVLRKLRPFHLFVQHYGALLAPMLPHAPERLPEGPADLATPRWSVRSAGDRAFVFYNGHVRQHALAAPRAVRFELTLPSGPLSFPSRPLDLPAGAHFIWPVNLPLADARLVYATAQPVLTLQGDGVETHVLQAQDGVPVELALQGVRDVRAEGAVLQVVGSGVDERVVIRDLAPGFGAEVRATTTAGRPVRLLVLNAAQAEGLMLLQHRGQPLLLSSPDEAWADPRGIELRSRSGPRLRWACWWVGRWVGPAAPTAWPGGRREGLFTAYEHNPPVVDLPPPQAEPLQPARGMPPVARSAPGGSAQAPPPELYGRSAAWHLHLPPRIPPGLAGLWLELDLAGDVAHLYSGLELLDDHYVAGPPWRLALGRHAQRLKAPLRLTLLPLRTDAPIYFAEGQRPAPGTGTQVAELRGLRLVPEYGLRLPLR